MCLLSFIPFPCVRGTHSESVRPCVGLCVITSTRGVLTECALFMAFFSETIRDTDGLVLALVAVCKPVLSPPPPPPPSRPAPSPAPVFVPPIPFQHPSCMTRFTQVLLLLHSRARWLPHGLALWFHRSFCRSCSRFRSLRDKCRLSWPPLKKKRAALSLTAGLLNTLPSRLVPKILPFHLQSVNLNLTLNSEKAFWESTKWPDIFVLY